MWASYVYREESGENVWMKGELRYVEWKKVGRVKLSSGKTSYVYYDLKEMMGFPRLLRDEVMRIAHTTKIDEIDVIIGIDYGGVPLAIALSLMTDIPYAVLRKEQKLHGTQKRIEGIQIKGKCLLLDDVKTTGNSLTKAKEYLEKNGYKVIETHVLLERVV